MSKKVKHSAATRRLRQHGVHAMVSEKGRRTVEGVGIVTLRVSDGYDTRRYSLERLLFHSSAAVMNKYLSRRPNMPFEHRGNLARHALYRLPSFAKWALLMESQGSLAMEPLHNPEVRHLASGQKLGPLTRRLFRHGSDPVGIRSRTVVAGWLAHQYVARHTSKPITWLSLAGGSAVHSMFMVDASRIEPKYLTFVDIDQNAGAIAIASEVTRLAGLQPEHTHLLVGDVFDGTLLAHVGGATQVDIVDMMGILEYLDDYYATKLIRYAYEHLEKGGLLVTCNMRHSNPQLHLHKRGVGWPGVIPRSVQQLLVLCAEAGITTDEVEIYQPMDGVYNVMRIQKT